MPCPVMPCDGSKIIFGRPNQICRVPIVLDGPDGLISFWLGPNHFGQVQILKKLVQKNLTPTKMIWTRRKLLVLNQNELDSPKSFWSQKRTRH